MEWKVRRSLYWEEDTGDEPLDTGSYADEFAQLQIVDAASLPVSEDVAREYVRAGVFEDERVLEEFAAWANTRKGRCATCGELPVEVDTDDGGVDQSTITIRCPHGVLVVQYHVVDTPQLPVWQQLRSLTTRDAYDACPYCRGKQAWLRARALARGATFSSPPGRVVHACPHHAVLDVVRNYVAWIRHEPRELVCTTRNVSKYRGPYGVKPPREVVISRPIPPGGEEDPVPAQELTIRTFGGFYSKIAGIRIKSEKYHTYVSWEDPEFDAVLRLYGSALLLPRQETKKEY